MKNIILTTILHLLLCISYSCFASSQSYYIKRLGMEDGMSSNYVVDITQDRQGYIWIATGTGVNRFDGNSFKLYNEKNSSLTGCDVNAVLGDPYRDKVWIAILREGLFCFDYSTETFTQISVNTLNINTENISDLIMASDSGLWITDFKYGIYHYNPDNNKTTEYNFSELQGIKDKFNTAVDDGMGNLYIGSKDEGLCVLSIKDKSVKHYTFNHNNANCIPDNCVNSILIDKDKNIWIGTNNGLSLFNPVSEKFINFKNIPEKKHSLISDQIWEIKQMSDGRIWIGTNMGGISILNMKENAFIAPENISFENIKASNDEKGLSGPNVRSILEDTFGNIWIANYRGGVDFISHTQPVFNIKPFNHEGGDSFNHKQVWGIITTSTNELWMCGDGEIAVYKNMKKNKTFSLIQYGAMPNTHVNVLLTDKNENIWMGTYKNGIFYYDRKKETIVRPGYKYMYNLDVCCFYEDSDGKIFIGTQTGVYSFKDGKINAETKINRRLHNSMIHGICRDKNGKLWLGTFGDGIYIFDNNNELVKHIQSEKGFSSNAISHMIVDQKGRIITATRNGINLFTDINNPDNYETFDASNNLANINVRALQLDCNGNIWISTNGGISRFDEKEKRFYNYSHQDGVPIGDFMDGSASIDNNGVIYFGSQNGICYFNPQNFSEKINISPVRITGFYVYNKNTENRDSETSYPTKNVTIELPHDRNTFKISFNVLDFAQNNQTEYEYMLDGLEKIWYNTHGENHVIFRNIPPGKYTFKVRARIRNQLWENTWSDINIKIASPWWLSTYACLIYLLIIVIVVCTLLRFYKRKVDLESSLDGERKRTSDIQELNDERIRFYTNITHELRTPLTLILSPLEDLLCDKSLSTQHLNRISIVHDSATRLLNLINSILEFRKTETQNRKLSVVRAAPGAQIYEIGLKYKELNSNHRVEYNINIEDNETKIFYDQEILTTILDNLLSNASKYTAEGSITLSLNYNTIQDVRYAVISIRDTGYGIPHESLPYIFDRYYQVKSKYQASGSGIGLAIVKALCELHEIILDVESTSGVGTCFTIRMLADNNYPNALHMKKTESETEILAPLESDNQTDSKPIMLIIDDNTELRSYVKSYFAEFFDVLTAKNGKEGIEIAQNRIPNIIISDIMMPEMDGIDMCRLIKENICTSHIPIILLTAKDSSSDKEAGYGVGADSYLTKPFSAKLLHSRVNNLLETRKKIAAGISLNAKNNELTGGAQHSLSPLDSRFIEKINNIIEEHLDMQKMDVSFIADKMCMSHSTLYRKIKAVTDMSSNEYIRKVKLSNSARLLIENRYTISEISYMTGFSSVAYFRQCFKDEYKMSPSEYLKSR